MKYINNYCKQVHNGVYYKCAKEKAHEHSRKGRTMIENVEVAYCMAKLEDAIRWEKESAGIYLDCNEGKQDATYNRMIARWSTMISMFELAFGVSYFKQY